MKQYTNEIQEEICTYEVSKLAKEKGFPQHIGDDAYIVENEYDDEYEVGCCYPIQFIPDYLPTITAPTQSLLQRWLREEKGIIVEVFVDDDSNMPLTYNIHQYKDWNWHCVCHHHGNYAVNDWELCLEDALKYALENLV